MPAAKRYLKFGGPGLPAGSHTFAYHRDGYMLAPRVVPGMLLPYDDVDRADEYVLRGQAEVVETPAPKLEKD